jgi:hypothetical protein
VTESLHKNMQLCCILEANRIHEGGENEMLQSRHLAHFQIMTENGGEEWDAGSQLAWT